MSTQNKTLGMRRRIAKDYCKSILWLDDEIKPQALDSAERDPYLNFFHPIAEEFHKQGVLCQLKSFPQITGDDDPYATDSDEITICQNLAKMADIVILDWHLGAQNALHAQQILNGLIDVGGTRFVIVLSQEPKLSEEFESALGHKFKKSNSGWYRCDKGQFAYLLQKNSFAEPGSANALLERIYEELALVYPDYLHWAAIEIAARIKHYYPQWLSSLPSDTDLAIIAENLHSIENIGEAVFENLLEDLKESITRSAIESLSSDSFTASEWPRAAWYKNLLEADVSSLPVESAQPLTGYIRSLLPLASESMQRQESDSILEKMLRRGANLNSIKEFKTSVEKLGDFSEVVSLAASTDSPIRMGSIFKSDDETKADHIWVCISQSCDCIRASNLLFLTGIASEARDPGIGCTFLRFQQTQYVFSPLANHLSSLAVAEGTREIEGLNHVGMLREVTVKRLIARYWGQTTRVGINQPRFIRELRKER